MLGEKFQQPQNIEKGKRNNNLFYTYRYTAPTLHSKKYSQFFINCYSNLLLKWPETTKNLSSDQKPRLRPAPAPQHWLYKYICCLSCMIFALSKIHAVCIVFNEFILAIFQLPLKVLVASNLPISNQHVADPDPKTDLKDQNHYAGSESEINIFFSSGSESHCVNWVQGRIPSVSRLLHTLILTVYTVQCTVHCTVQKSCRYYIET